MKYAIALALAAAMTMTVGLTVAHAEETGSVPSIQAEQAEDVAPAPAETQPASNDEAVEKAVEEAGKWLEMVDEGKFDQSWDTAAGYFKNAVTKDQWLQAVAGARIPLGAVVSREVSEKAFMTQLPGAPDGEYVVIIFKTEFANKKTAKEVVTPMKDEDGAWRVSGYYVN